MYAVLLLPEWFTLIQTCIQKQGIVNASLVHPQQQDHPTFGSTCMLHAGVTFRHWQKSLCSGDSFSQTGFNVTGSLPDASNPLGNPAFPGYTAASGENWVGFVSASFNNSVLYTYNFANSDATIDANLVAPLQPSVLSLVDQVNLFLNSVGNQSDMTPWTSDNSLFSVWIGSYDISFTYSNEGDQSASVITKSPSKIIADPLL